MSDLTMHPMYAESKDKKVKLAPENTMNKLDLDKLQAEYSEMIKVATDNFLTGDNTEKLMGCWQNLAMTVPHLVARVRELERQLEVK